MGKFSLLVVISLMVTEMVFAQAKPSTVKGIIMEKDSNIVVPKATITLLSKKDSSLKYNTVSDSSGAFQMQSVTPDTFLLSISADGHQPLSRQILITDSTVDLGNIFLANTEFVEKSDSSQASTNVAVRDTTPKNYSINDPASIKGVLKDKEDRSNLARASVTITLKRDSTIKHNAVTDTDGSFSFPELTADTFLLAVSSIGYETVDRQVNLLPSLNDLGIILIPKTSKELQDVVVVAKTPPAQQKGDTVQYNASQFKVNPDATVEDLVKKMPGITVDKDGTVTAQGDQVKKVTIDGRDFFGDDATAALRNLPSDVVDKIQVFDRLSDQAQVTGVDDGNSVKSINIITKAGMKNGQFGRLYAGYGTDDRYQAGGNVSFFKDNRRISLVGLTNNVNQQNFGSQDLLGVTSSTGANNRGGGGGGGGNRGGGGGGNNGGGGGGGNFGGNNTGSFVVGQQSGISKTNAIGINYSDLWGKKVTVSASYFYNNSSISNDRISNMQSFVKPDSTLFLDDTSFSVRNNYNHRVNARVEYKIDSSNTLIVTPSFNYQKNNTLSNTNSKNYYDLLTGLQSQSFNTTNALISGYTFNNNILFRHSFAKRGRTISLNLATAFNDRKGDTYSDSRNIYYNTAGNTDTTLQQYYNNTTSGNTVSANLIYTEPVGKKGQIQINYNPSFTKNKADQRTFGFDTQGGKYSVFDTTLSNKFNNSYNTQNSGLTYRIGDRDNQFSAGLNYQYSTLESDQVFPVTANIKRSFSNLLPNLQLRRKLSAKSSIRLFYRTSVNAPSVNQLQNVIDYSNQLRVTTGNPELDQQYTHSLVGRYTFTNTQKGQSFFANVFLQKVNGYVANATYTAAADSLLAPGIILYKGSQLVKPVNLDGYWNIRTFFTFGQPVKALKSIVNLNAGFTYSKLPGLVNGSKTLSNAYNYNVGAVVASNISEYIDFNFSYTANFNTVKNSLQPELNNNYITQVAGFQFNLLSKSGWFLQNDLNNQSYSGLTAGFNQRFWLWNMSAGKKFFKDKQGELKLSVFDLLKQNQSITRTTGDSYIEDVQNKVLQQYFMLTFTYSLKNFGKAKPVARPTRQRS